MRASRAALLVAGLAAVAAAAVSGGSGTDPQTPRGPAGLPPPFVGVAVIGGGGATGAVDAYGNLVDLRPLGPAGPPSLAVSAERQAAGSVDPDSVRVATAQVEGRRLPLWRADSVSQRYLPGTNVLVTVSRFGARRVRVVRAIGSPARAAAADRRWIARARPLGAGAPAWARRLHRRSLLVLRALTDRRSGAVAAGAREGWAYVWPRDAAAAAMALSSAGYRAEARRVARFLMRLDLDDAARFDGAGRPVQGRSAQGDATGWARAAARAAGLRAASGTPRVAGLRAASGTAGGGGHWQDRADYQEKAPGDYLGNALAARSEGLASSAGRPKTGPYLRFQAGRRDEGLRRAFGTPRGLVRVAGEPGSGLDSAAAWAVRPFPRPALRAAARRTLLRLAAEGGRYGIVPSEDWEGGEDPWTAPTAWCAWSLAALGERGAALRLLEKLRRAATPLGTLPERVDAESGLPRSTTPLAWSHAFAILALRTLWPGGAY
jgi:hypothetical protein